MIVLPFSPTSRHAFKIRLSLMVYVYFLCFFQLLKRGQVKTCELGHIRYLLLLFCEKNSLSLVRPTFFRGFLLIQHETHDALVHIIDVGTRDS